MEDLEEEIKHIREKNSQLVQELQALKVASAQKDKEKLELIKEVNDLRLKISRLRSGGAALARKLDTELQTTTEQALSYLVQASGTVLRTRELSKQYMLDRQELDSSSPRWSAISGTPSNEKVHRVPPLLIGGQSIQPVVSLSRTVLNSHNRSNPNQTSSVSDRAVPLHMLQDVYIPLTRIDLAEFQNNTDDGEDTNRESIADDGFNASEQSLDESRNLSDLDETGDSRRLDAVMEEDLETEDVIQTPPRSRVENPLEGPSWLLDIPDSEVRRICVNAGVDLEPDSTTPCLNTSPNPRMEANPAPAPPPTMPEKTERESESSLLLELSPLPEQSSAPLPEPSPLPEPEQEPLSMTMAFTPTVRRRKRNSSPPQSHRFSNTRNSGRVLKIVLNKLRISDAEPNPSPPKRPSLNTPDNTLPSPITHDVSLALSIESPTNDVPVLNSTRDAETTRQSEQESEEIRVSESRVYSNDVSPCVTPIREAVVRTERPAQVASPVRVFDAPSPNGATDAHVIVSNQAPTRRRKQRGRDTASRSHGETSRHDGIHRGVSNGNCRGDTSRDSIRSRANDSDANVEMSGRSRRPRNNVTYKERLLNSDSSRDSSLSCADDGDATVKLSVRTRRPRNNVTYKEKPLNRKMRR